MRVFLPLFTAIQFLTRLPVPIRHLPDDKTIGRSLLYYPFVGLLIGLGLAVLHVALLRVAAPNLLRAALELALWVIMTGALHLDGLADTVDAWAGGRGNRQRTLDIMKDPTSGPMGVTAIVLVLIMKFAALSTIFAQQWYILLLAPFAARCALVWLFLRIPYVRKGGIGEALSQHAPRLSAKIVLVIFTSAALLLYVKPAVVAFVSALLVYAWFGQDMRRRIGGTTGDTAGAMVELTETLTLTVMAVLQSVY